MPVHLNGALCAMDALRDLAARRGLRVVEDCAQALLSRHPAGGAGTFGDAGVFSMSIAKLLVTGEGGFVAARDAALARRLRELRNHGVLALAGGRFERFGFNFRLTDVMAAMGLAQEAKLERKIAAVRAVHAYYTRELAGVPGVRVLESRVADGEVPLWTQVLCARRDAAAAFLAARGIQTRPFYPCLGDAVHLAQPGPFPHAERFAREGLTLPSGPDQPEENLARVVAALRAFAREA
jgi:perosamine synthetase